MNWKIFYRLEKEENQILRKKIIQLERELKKSSEYVKTLEESENNCMKSLNNMSQRIISYFNDGSINIKG